MDLDPNTASEYWYIILVEFVVLLLPVFLVLRRYASFKKLPLYVYISVYFGWYISMMIILLLPIDITSSSFVNCLKEHNITNYNQVDLYEMNDTSSSSSSSQYQHAEIECTKPTIYLPEVFTSVCWNVLFWASFFLCWFIYPIMQSYSTSGEFNISGKIKASIVENIWFYGIMGIVGLIFLIIYIIVTKSFSLIPLCKALSNAWGLCLLILTLGYGVVTIPKKVWHRSSVKKRLSKYYFDVGKAKGKLNDARDDLLKTLRLLKSYDTYMDTSDPFRKYVNTILEREPTGYESQSITCSTNDPDIDYKKLVKLHYNVMFYDHEYKLCYDLYVKAVKKAINAEDIIKCMNAGDHNITWTTKKPRSSFVSKLEWLLFCKLRNPLLKLITFILVLLSLIVVWSECIFSVDKPVMSVFALMISPPEINSSDIYVTLTLFIPLFYLIVCSYWSLFQLRIFRYYRLIPGQHSDSNSLLFSAAYLTRLAAPLALNFIHMLKLKGTIFQDVMSSMEKVPIIGDSLFNEYAPMLLIVVCAFFGFNVLGRVLWCCECSKYYYHDPSLNDDEIEYGKALVRDERGLWSEGVRRDTLIEEFEDPETGRLAPQRAKTPDQTPKYVSKIFGNSRPDEYDNNSPKDNSDNGNESEDNGDKFKLSKYGSKRYSTFAKNGKNSNKSGAQRGNYDDDDDDDDEEAEGEVNYSPRLGNGSRSNWGSSSTNSGYYDNSSQKGGFKRGGGWKKVS